MFGRLRWNIYLLTVDTELDLSAGVAHRTGGSADVDACILGGGVGDEEVSIRLRLKGGVVPGQWLPPLEEMQAWDHPESTVDKSCLHNSAGTLSLVFTAQPLMSNVISEHPPQAHSLSPMHAHMNAACCTRTCFEHKIAFTDSLLSDKKLNPLDSRVLFRQGRGRKIRLISTICRGTRARWSHSVTLTM